MMKLACVICWMQREKLLFLFKGKLDRESLNTERMLTLSLVRLLEIIGEAASRVSKEKQERIPEIPWRQMIGMRNRLIHAYFDIDLDFIWQTVTEDLVPLIAELEKVLSEG